MGVVGGLTKGGVGLRVRVLGLSKWATDGGFGDSSKASGFYEVDLLSPPSMQVCIPRSTLQMSSMSHVTRTAPGLLLHSSLHVILLTNQEPEGVACRSTTTALRHCLSEAHRSKGDGL